MEWRKERQGSVAEAMAQLAHLQTYWRGLMRHGLPPRRGDIEPGRIGPALPGAFVLDRIAPGEARLRLAGQALFDAAGTEACGLPLSRLFESASRPRLAELVEQGFAQAWPCNAPLTCGRLGHVGGLLLLPLRGHEDAAPQMLGALLHGLQPGRVRRFAFAGPTSIGAPAATARPLRLVSVEAAPA